MTEVTHSGRPVTDIPDELDTVVVGAGFGGMYMLYKLRELGLSTIVFEAAPDVGGTWYWNAYPGARCDVESLVYNYAFDPALRQEYQSKWKDRYCVQPDILTYAHDVADRYDLWRDICFETRVTRATWDDEAGRWTVETDRGNTVRARYLIAAVGCLSDAQVPDFPGLETFGGAWYHTGRWPHEKVDFTGKRVVQIGTGSSGIQAAPVIAAEAAHLTILQRTAQFSIPARNFPLTPEKVQESLNRAEALIARYMAAGPDIPPFWEGLNPESTFDVTPEERQAHFEELWDAGGPLFFLAYRDTMTDPAANEAASEFARQKIRSVVKDPETADKLMPTYPIGTKRIVIDTDYFETFNRDNVTLEDIRSDPIDRIVPEGVRLRSGKLIEADIIVFATGFDAMTGPIMGLNILGRGGQSIADAWAEGPRTFLGIASHGFPNLFFLTGPGSPSVLSNVIYSLEQHVNWLSKLLEYATSRGVDRIEAALEDQDRWVDHCRDLADQTLWPRADSWYMGANIPGKPRVFLPYIGGNARYQVEIDKVADEGYAGFELSGSRDTVPLNPVT